MTSQAGNQMEDMVTISVLGLVVLTFNIIGFLCGFVFLEMTPQQITDDRILLMTKQSASLTTSRGPRNRPGSIPNYMPQPQPPPASGHPFASQSKVAATTLGLPWNQQSSRNGWTRSGGLKQPNASCLYRKGRDSEDGVWYDFGVDDSLRFYAYTAFIDDRPSIGSEAVVRIIALSTKLEDDDLDKAGKTLYCAFHHDDSETRNPDIVLMNSKAGPIGFGLDLDSGFTLKEYIFTCPLGRWRHPLPVAVTILGGLDRLSTVTSCVPIEVPRKPPAKGHFAVCVQVSYGHLNPHRLIEWLELQRILGVGRVGVYDLSINSGPGLDVLRHYAREGFVDLRRTEALPVPGRSHQHLLHGSPVINDCLYRNMHGFSWVLVIDLDEVLVPRNHSNLIELAKYLEETYSRSPLAGPANYLFHNQYFFLDSDPDLQESTDYTILRHRRKAPLSPHGYAMKGYVNPQGCVQMHNHYCMGVAETFVASNHYQFVDPSLATSHHYKRCHLSFAECQEMLMQTTQDDVMMTFKTKLKVNVEKKIRDVIR